MPKVHGLSRVNGKRTKLFIVWCNMRSRCNTPGASGYGRYGARGIKVCPQWDDYPTFMADVGEYPGAGWTLDRVDNDGNYEPSNVRWAKRTTQARNRRTNVVDDATVAAIRQAYGLPYLPRRRAPGGVTHLELARRFNVSLTHIGQILRGDAWL